MDWSWSISSSKICIRRWKETSKKSLWKIYLIDLSLMLFYYLYPISNIIISILIICISILKKIFFIKQLVNFISQNILWYYEFFCEFLTLHKCLVYKIKFIRGYLTDFRLKKNMRFSLIVWFYAKPRIYLKI